MSDRESTWSPSGLEHLAEAAMLKAGINPTSPSSFPRHPEPEPDSDAAPIVLTSSPSDEEEERPLSMTASSPSPAPVDSQPPSRASASVQQQQQQQRPTLVRAGTDPYTSTLGAPHRELSSSLQHIMTQPGSSSSPRQRARRYADPDTHWLSGDEGEAMIRDTAAGGGRSATGHARRRGHNTTTPPDSKDEPPDDSDKREALYISADTRSQNHHHHHPIHHRPSPIYTDLSSNTTSKYTATLSDLGLVLRTLFKALSCPSCNNLMQDPTTLQCGHSSCLRCSAPNASPLQIQRVALSSTLSSITATSTLRSRSPDTTTNNSNIVDPVGPTSTTVNRAVSPPKVLLADTECPLGTCRKTTRAKSHTNEGIRPDFVLQKLTAILRSHLPESEDVDDFLADSEQEQQNLQQSYDNDVDERNEKSSSPASSPEEIPQSDTVPKRSMTRRKPWSSSKRAKNTTSAPTSGLPTMVKDILSELECQVCVTLIYEPLTTPCGHTFCKKCLVRSLDHSDRCPLCRSQLPGINFFLAAPLNATISTIFLTAFPMVYQERKESAERDQADTGLDTPIFVCMVAFPDMPTNLHIYEPRYRLMMRRAMDVNKRFGMVLPSRSNGGISQYGTMLEIQDLTLFDDGRSLVRTRGVHRFKILESGTLDGYTVGRVERVEDIIQEEEDELERLALARGAAASHGRASSQGASSGGDGSQATAAPTVVSLPPQRTPSTQSPPQTQSPNPQQPADYPEQATDKSEQTNKELMNICKGFVEALRTGSTPWLIQRLNDSMPPMPEDPSEFTWWMAMLMPIDDHEKAKLLQITSYRLRLRLIVFWIQQMQHSWWFSRGCTIS